MKKKTIAMISASALLLGGLTAAFTGCSSTPTEPATTVTEAATTKSYNSSYGSYNSGSYGSKTTEKPTYKQDDPYYRANDYDNDGSLSLDEFQGAVNDWMDDHDSYSSTTKKSYGSYNSGSYGSKTTEKPTYKQDDPYYRANDYDNDGSLSLDEFQGAVNDWLDANGY